MKLGMSTASYFYRLPIEDTLLDIAAHGVKLVEMFLNSFCEYEDGFCDVLLDRLKSTGQSVYSVHPMSTQFEPQLFSKHDRQRADARNIYRQVLKTGKRLGAKVYVMHGAAFLSGATNNIHMARNCAIDSLASTLSELSDIAADYGITLSLENVSWCVFSRPETGAALRDLLGDKLSYTLDIKQAIRAGQDPLAFVDALGKRIVNLHLCDAVKDPNGVVSLAMPGRGGFDYAMLKERMKNEGCTGPAFMEVYNDMYGDVSELYESYAAMRRIFD